MAVFQLSRTKQPVIDKFPGIGKLSKVFSKAGGKYTWGSNTRGWSTSVAYLIMTINFLTAQPATILTRGKNKSRVFSI